MPGFLRNVQECDATEAGLWIKVDLIKNKNTFHLLFQQKRKLLTSNIRFQILNFK